MRVVSCNPNWLFEGNFGIHIFFLGTAKVKKALARMFLKKVGEWTQKLKQNFNFIKFNFIFSKQQTHYKSHCEVQGYKRLQPPHVTCKELWVCRACPRAGDGSRRDACLKPMQGHHPRVHPVGEVTTTLTRLGPSARGKETSVVFPKFTQKIKYNKRGVKKEPSLIRSRWIT